MQRSQYIILRYIATLLSRKETSAAGGLPALYKRADHISLGHGYDNPIFKTPYSMSVCSNSKWLFCQGEKNMIAIPGFARVLGWMGLMVCLSFVLACAPKPYKGENDAKAVCDICAPEVMTISPANGASAAPRNSAIVLTFNQQMVAAATEGAFSTAPATTGAFAWSGGGKVMTYTPSALLANAAAYSVGLAATAREVNGRFLPAAYTSTYTTENAIPTVVSTAPAAGASAFRKTTISLTFSRAMNTAATQGAFSTTPATTGTFAWNSPANTVMTYTPNVVLTPGVITISLTTAATEAAYNTPLAANFSSSFTAVSMAYAANQGSNDVSAYTINPTTGALTAITGSPFVAGTTPLSMAGDPTAKFAYVANYFNGAGGNSVSAYAINPTTGALTAVTGSPFAAGTNPRSVTVDPTGRFAYAANQNSNNVSAYTINGTTGALTPITGSPFAAGASPVSVTTY